MRATVREAFGRTVDQSKKARFVARWAVPTCGANLGKERKQDALWEPVHHARSEQQDLHRTLTYVYSLLKAGGDLGILNPGGDGGEAADPRVWVDGRELTWPQKFVFADPPTSVRPRQEKAENFTVLEVGAYLYQGLSTPTSWWIDGLAVGKQRIGCE